MDRVWTEQDRIVIRALGAAVASFAPRFRELANRAPADAAEELHVLAVTLQKWGEELDRLTK